MLNDLLWVYYILSVCCVSLIFFHQNKLKENCWFFFLRSLVFSSGINNIKGLLIEKILELNVFRCAIFLNFGIKLLEFAMIER